MLSMNFSDITKYFETVYARTMKVPKPQKIQEDN